MPEKATGFLPATLCVALAATSVVVAQAGEERRSPAPTFLELSAKTRAARLAGNEDAWLELARATLELAPEHPDLHVSAARAAAAKGAKQDVLLHLSDAVRRGAGFDPVELTEFAGLLNDRSLESVFAAARANLAPVARAEEFARIADADLRPEGITYDPKTSRLFVGSARGEIWQIDSSGKSTPFVRKSSGLKEVYGLKIDERRRLLWAATAVFPDLMRPETPAKPDVGVTGLVAFDLDTGRKREEHWLDERPTIHGFNDLAVTQLGEVFATDSATGSVYRLEPDTHRFYVVATGADMTFPNGIVLSEDESHLHVAHVEGISRIDLRTGARERLRVADTVSVNSIDGLARAGRSLIGIQGSPYLSRVIRIDLAEEGRSVGKIDVLSSRTPRELAQTTATVAGRFVYVVAGSAAVNLQTTASNADRPVRPVILRIDMDQAP